MAVSPKVIGSQRDSAATRDSILESARSFFARESYEAVGVREIAGAAGVDPALINRYFGSKEELFKNVLGAGAKEDLFLGVGRDQLPQHLARLLMETPPGAPRTEKLEHLLIILRSSSSPVACELVRESMHKHMLGAIAELLDGEDTEFRASLAMAVLMGTAIIRSVMAVSPICDQRTDHVERCLVRLFSAALAEGDC
ncbi:MULTISPECIES: TetR/AcrR family transcriptional regulator [unclassified Sphingosinithalassobacter]|uniref:TetR/AcrR family transcriptional regulator n=1 Tax=unclassified Sphingosinithalassobacter TaxID=2676235 RepID=UPI00165EAA2D|nr:TetR/AcrR family transcriptional regulator [Sphingosinithalassobacter sp. CS137]